MPARTAYAGAATAGEVLTAANVNRLPGGWLGYSEVTANQTGITTAVDLTNLTVTVTVGTGRRIRLVGYGTFQNTVAGNGALLTINEGATQFQIGAMMAPAANNGFTLIAQAIITPVAGAHTYKLRASNQIGGTVALQAGVGNPAFILVEDLGPAT